MRRLLAACLVTAAAVGATGGLTPAFAQSAKAPAEAAGPGAHPKSSYYRRAPQVRGFVQRRGGYSYTAADVMNTYGNSRSVYGSTNTYRNHYLDLQSRSGPFDHGFFFDSGISPRGGNAPY
jgi:hypothetical protein